MNIFKWIFTKILSWIFPLDEPEYLPDNYQLKPDETKRWMENTVMRDNHNG